MERSQSSILAEIEKRRIEKSEVPEGPPRQSPSPEVSGSVHWWGF